MSEDSIYFKLDELTSNALHARAAYIMEHAAAIGVRVEIDGRWQSLFLTELPPDLAMREAFRLLLRAEVPIRKAPPKGEQG